MGESHFTPTPLPHYAPAASKQKRSRADDVEQNTLGFLRFLGLFGDDVRKGGGGQGWIRTSVRLRGQIYSLLPLTTRPPVHTGHFIEEIVRSRGDPVPRGAPLAKRRLPVNALTGTGRSQCCRQDGFDG